jgi:MYXO-CTERM domain-containing protein
MNRINTISMIAAAGLAAAASADITGAYVVSYQVTAADFDGSDVTVNVQDLYLASDDGADTVLNVYNFVLAETGMVNYFQSFDGSGWTPTNLGGPFDTAALRLADSFVTLGGFAQDTLRPEQAPGAGAETGISFSENALYPPEDSGWSGGPGSGQVGIIPNENGDLVGLGVLIGRFSFEGDFTLAGSTLLTSWNQGLGTPGQATGVTVVPAPGALALLGLAGLAGRRRRG